MNITDHNFISFKNHLRFTLSALLPAFIIAFLIMSAGRLIFIHSFTEEAVLKTWGTPVFSAFLEKCVLFDLKYAAQAFLPALLAAFIFGWRQNLCKFYQRIFWIFNLLGFLYVLLLTIINYYYYLTYSRIIDVFFFAFLQEDPVATLKTLYEDYPLIQGVLACIAGSAGYLWLFSKLRSRVSSFIKLPGKKLSIFALIAFFIILDAAALRGSFGTFPLRQNSAQVSSDPLVNLSVPNGPAALHWARKWARQQAEIPEVEISQLQKDYAALGIEAPDADNLYAPLEFTTPQNDFLEKNPPDLVISIQESMSTHMSLYDDPQKRDLFGQLRRHTKEDFWFRNFLSEGNGTMDSLTRILLEVPDLNLSTSTQGERNYITNSLRAFKEKGYRIVFVTGCQGSWRDMNNYFRRIGMDEVYEMSTLMQWYPDATSFAWGVDDEYMWRGVLKVLREKHDQPLLVFTLSISNHPPFRVAENVEPKTIELSAEELKRFPYPNTTTLFATYRYANDQYGRFISEIKRDPKLANRTILAATGDHNMRGIGYDAYPDELALGHAVPFYMYIPHIYQEHDTIVYDPKQWGSQKDLFATVASHSLSLAKMHTFGCDLLGNKDDCRYKFAFNSEAAVPWNSDYVCDLSGIFQFKAMKLKDDTDDLRAIIEPALKDASLCKKAQAFSKLERDLYYYQAKHGPKLP